MTLSDPAAALRCAAVVRVVVPPQAATVSAIAAVDAASASAATCSGLLHRLPPPRCALSVARTAGARMRTTLPAGAWLAGTAILSRHHREGPTLLPRPSGRTSYRSSCRPEPNSRQRPVPKAAYRLGSIDRRSPPVLPGRRRPRHVHERGRRAQRRAALAQPGHTERSSANSACQLFHRVSRGARLTSAGEAMVAPARRTLRDFEETLAAVHNVKELRSGRLVVVCSTASRRRRPTAAARPLPRSVPRRRDQHHRSQRRRHPRSAPLPRRRRRPRLSRSRVSPASTSRGWPTRRCSSSFLPERATSAP